MANPDLSEQAKRLLEYLKAHASPDGEVKVLWMQVAKDLGISLATVKRARAELVQVGELVLVKAGGGRAKASVYRLSRFNPTPAKSSGFWAPSGATRFPIRPLGKALGSKALEPGEEVSGGTH
jgi:hypothetical protein